MKVYLISDGDYEDYTIIGAFSTYKKAKDAAKYFNANERIEEYDLDSKLKQRPAGMKAFCVAMDREGNVPLSKWTNKINVYECSGDYADRNVVQGYGGNPAHVEFNVWARDEEHAIKIANEKRGGVLIAGEWPGDE